MAASVFGNVGNLEAESSKRPQLFCSAIESTPKGYHPLGSIEDGLSRSRSIIVCLAGQTKQTTGLESYWSLFMLAFCIEAVEPPEKQGP